MADQKIVWLNIAKAEFKAILEFYFEGNQSATYSLKLIDQTEDLLNTLSKSELIGRLTSNNMTKS
ncbi:MAG: hypothetical protein ABR595_08835 [Psychroflexus sp.]